MVARRALGVKLAGAARYSDAAITRLSTRPPRRVAPPLRIVNPDSTEPLAAAP